MKKSIVEKHGRISFVGYEGEPDDLTKAIFQKGDIVSASDKCEHNFPSQEAIVDCVFLSLGEEEIKYAVKGVRDDNGKQWCNFFRESELKLAKGADNG